MKVKLLIPILLLCLFPSTVFAADAKFETKKEAAEYVRKQMINREASADFLLKSSDSMDEDKLKDDILNLAYTYSPSLPGSGDYLKLVTYCRPSNPDSVEENGYQAYKFTLTYVTDKQQEEIIQKRITDLLKSLNLANKSTLIKIQTIYDYLTKNINYTDRKQGEEKDLYDTPYTALNYKALNLNNPQCRCEGFAGLFYRMLQQSGISCKIVQGDISISNNKKDDQPHSWNIVKYKGYWFSCDPTVDSNHPNNLTNFMVPGSSHDNDTYSSFIRYDRSNKYKGSFYTSFPMAVEPVLDPGLSIKLKDKNFLYKKIKKKRITFNPVRNLKRKSSDIPITYKILNPKKNKGIKINRNTGKITIKKKTKKGLYRVKIQITAGEVYGYKKSTIKKMIKIRIK